MQFDLEAAAFPPLPGLDADHGKASTDIVGTGITNAVGVESSSQNRLSDVVKGTAKLKTVIKDKESGSQQQPQVQQQQTATLPSATANVASRSASPGAAGTGTEIQGNTIVSTNSANAAHALNTTSNDNASSTDTAALSTVPLTPPSSPDK